MARKVQVLLVDDLDGTELGTNGETVAFGMGGERYELDLSPDNAKKFRDAMGTYVSAARNVTRVKGGSTSSGSRRGSSGSGRVRMDREQSNAVRMWARVNGWPKLADRGRIPAEVVEAFNANSGRQIPMPEATAPAKPSLAETKGEVPPKDTGKPVNGKEAGTASTAQRPPAANSTKPAKPAAEAKQPTPA